MVISGHYWLHWQVPICALVILLPSIVALVLIFRIKRAPLYASDLWKPCWRGLHPIWLLGYRALVFVFMSLLLYRVAAKDGHAAFYFYTQWTFTLVTLYFALGSVIAAYGCWEYSKTPASNNGERDGFLKRDSEEIESNVIFVSETNKSENSITPGRQAHEETKQIAGSWGYLMQIVYQICAGAAMLTDIVFWCLLLPQADEKFTLTLLDGSMHSLNLVFLLIDTSLNKLPFPWYGMIYFVFWSCIYIIFQWVLHACCVSWWPYNFLELSTPWAPLWYFALAVVHIPCYWLYISIVKVKNSIFTKLFPRAYVRTY